MDAILQAYKEFSYPSAEKLYQVLNKKYTLQKIKEALNGSTVRQLYYKRPPKKHGHILATGPNQFWECDLTILSKFGTTNKHYNYLLLCVDVFSRYAWAIPLKTKTIDEVVDAFKSIGDKPEYLVSDNGSEFMGKEFQDMLNKMDITHRSAIIDDHHALGIVDRVTRTLKNMIYRNFIAENNTNWISKIEEIIKAYNNTPNKGIYDYKPIDGLRNDTVIGVLTTINQNLMKSSENKEADVKEGDTVRVALKKDKFTRGYHPKWTSKTEKIEKVVGDTVYINGKRHKIRSIQVVKSGGAEGGEELKKALKEDKVKRVLRKEGIERNNEVKHKIVGLKVRGIPRGSGYVPQNGNVVREIHHDNEPISYWVEWDDGKGGTENPRRPDVPRGHQATGKDRVQGHGDGGRVQVRGARRLYFLPNALRRGVEPRMGWPVHQHLERRRREANTVPIAGFRPHWEEDITYGLRI